MSEDEKVTEATLADRVRNETKRLQMQGVLFDAETFYAAKDAIEALTISNERLRADNNELEAERGRLATKLNEIASLRPINSQRHYLASDVQGILTR
jgi:hypothetical protein